MEFVYILATLWLIAPAAFLGVFLIVVLVAAAAWGHEPWAEWVSSQTRTERLPAPAPEPTLPSIRKPLDEVDVSLSLKSMA